MSDNNRLLMWTARILAILFILFISMFALDVFEEGYKWWEVIIALFMHLIPSYFLIAATVLAWRWPKLGGMAFVLLGIVSIFAFKTYSLWMSLLLISLLPMFIGGLFLWDGFQREA